MSEQAMHEVRGGGAKLLLSTILKIRRLDLFYQRGLTSRGTARNSSRIRSRYLLIILVFFTFHLPPAPINPTTKQKQAFIEEFSCLKI
jgi:hypothetical protein